MTTKKYYTVNDLQGAGLKAGRVYATIADLIVELADFHSIDWTDEEYPEIYDLLNSLPDEQAQIDYLCDYGSWEVVEHEGEPKVCKECQKNLAIEGLEFCEMCNDLSRH